MTTSVQVVDFTSFVFAQGDDIKTTSRIVAEKFGKRHDNVLATIDKILTQVSDIFGKLNFKETEYVQNNNLGIPVSYRMFEMTKDGFMILVMGFTGVPAMAIKETYINAFNFMVEKLRPKPYALRDLPKSEPKFLTPAMLRHIQRRVSWLSFNQVGSTHAGLGKLIKDTFNVHKRDMIPIEKYTEVCTLLGCEPNAKALQGDLLEPAKVEYQPPAGMVLIDVAELEALQIPDDKLLVDKRLHEALIEFQYSLPVDNKLTFSPPAGIATLKIEDYEVMKFKAAQFDKLKGILKA